MTRPTPTVRVLQEEEAPRAWRFVVEVALGDDVRTVSITLGWADYNHWSQGRLTPTEVIQGVVTCAVCMLSLQDLPDEIDASTLRRLAPGLEHRVGEFFDR